LARTLVAKLKALISVILAPGSLLLGEVTATAAAAGAAAAGAAMVAVVVKAVKGVKAGRGAG
jgi:hypothetical protein